MYFAEFGGLPPQNSILSDRATFTEAYVVIPKGAQRDIVTTRLPGWQDTRFWVLARPLSGFAETFSHYVGEISPGGGSETPEPDPGAEAVLFVVRGTLRLDYAGETHHLLPGGYAYLPPGLPFTLAQDGQGPVYFHWIRKRYTPVPGLAPPEAFVTSDQETPPIDMPDTDGRWTTTRFVDPDDVAHDMHVNIVNLFPGSDIPFMETHVMEHGLYILQGKGVYRLNQDWVEVEAGDYLWLRAFCPQACYAAGAETFRYLLYKDMHRHADLTPRLP